MNKIKTLAIGAMMAMAGTANADWSVVAEGSTDPMGDTEKDCYIRTSYESQISPLKGYQGKVEMSIFWGLFGDDDETDGFFGLSEKLVLEGPGKATPMRIKIDDNKPIKLSMRHSRTGKVLSSSSNSNVFEDMLDAKTVIVEITPFRENSVHYRFDMTQARAKYTEMREKCAAL